jgi:hypothetical protein
LAGLGEAAHVPCLPQMASLVSGDGVQSCSEAEVNSAQESAAETIEKLSLRSQFPEVTIEGDSFNSGQFAMIRGGLAETRDFSRAFYQKSHWERIMREIDQAEPSTIRMAPQSTPGRKTERHHGTMQYRGTYRDPRQKAAVIASNEKALRTLINIGAEHSMDSDRKMLNSIWEQRVGGSNPSAPTIKSIT